MTAATLPAVARSPRTRRTNRGVLALLGLLLLAAGAAGIAAGAGAFGDDIRHRKAIPRYTRQWVYSHGWFWLAVAAGSILIALLALRWLLTQTSTNRVARFDLEPDHRTGRTVLAARAVTDAVAEEIESYRGVTGASAQLIGSAATTTLLLRVTLDDRTDPTSVRDRVETEAVRHARQALDKTTMPVRLELGLAGSTRRDVR